MIRKVISSLVETTIQPACQEAMPYSHPFTKPDTTHFSWLMNAAPCFPVNAKNITILTEPQQFYDSLLKNCKTARDRITIASLYLGTGSLELRMVESLLGNERFSSGKLKVDVLLDCMRGSRYKHNSRQVLKPLLQHGESCRVSLYHTPVLRGLWKKFIPNRWDEIFGLQHMKLYIFDNTLIISGANLSNDYFTNRQDRYFMIKDKTLCDFYSGLVERVQKFSLQMDKNDELLLDETWKTHPYEGQQEKFIQEAGDSIETYLVKWKEEQNTCKREGNDTWIFPLIQMGQLGIQNDEVATSRLLSEAPIQSHIFISTGYFNLTQNYMNTIVDNSQAKCSFLAAHPNANGFQGASFPSGGIPAAYSLIAQKFFKKTENVRNPDRITVREYLRNGWTYHAKGLWYYPPDSSTPCLTLIGSPNFGERSTKRDLESQVAIVTENDVFRRKLDDECKGLYDLSLPLDCNRTTPLWVYPLVYFFRGYF